MFKVIKLDKLNHSELALTRMIGFLFVPSGISVNDYSWCMGQNFVQILTVIVVQAIIYKIAVTGLLEKLI